MRKRLLAVPTRWVSRAVHYVEAVGIVVEWTVSRSQLKWQSGHLSGNSVITG